MSARVIQVIEAEVVRGNGTDTNPFRTVLQSRRTRRAMGVELRRLKRFRRLAYERQAGLCYWCRMPMIVKTKQNGAKVWQHPRLCTADHLVRRADGGITVEENIVAACAECNSSRHWSSFEQPMDGRATLGDVWPVNAAS